MNDLRLEGLRYIHDDFARDKQTISRAAIESVLNSPSGTGYKEKVLSKIGHDVCATVGAYKHKRDITIPFSLTSNEMKVLEECYPGYKIVFTSETNNDHAFAASSRILENSELQHKLGYDKTRDYTVFLQNKGYDTYFTDIGANFPLRARAGEKHVHCCSPVINNADAQRFTNRIGKFDAFVANSDVVTDSIREVCDNVRLVVNGHALETKTFCMRRVQDCDNYSLYGIALHSLYDISFHELGAAMLNKRMYTVVGTLAFDDQMFQYATGTIRDSKMRWEYVENFTKIRCNFEDDASRSYVHDTRTYFGWLICSMFIYEGKRFYIELLEHVAGVIYLKITMELRSPEENEMIHHRIPVRSLKGKVMVTVKHRDFDLACEELSSFWSGGDTRQWRGGNSDAEFFPRSGDRNLYKRDICKVTENGEVVVRFFVSKELYEVGKSFALGNSEAKFKPGEIFSFIRSHATRIYYGKEAIRKYDIEAMHMYHLAYAIYLTCYDQKYILGKSCERKIQSKAFNRELEQRSVMRRCLSVLYELAKLCIYCLPPIYIGHSIYRRLDLWTYRVLRREFLSSEAVIAPIESFDYVTEVKVSNTKRIQVSTVLPVICDSELGSALKGVVDDLVFSSVGPESRSTCEREAVVAVAYADKGKTFVTDTSDAGPGRIVRMNRGFVMRGVTQMVDTFDLLVGRLPIGSVCYVPFRASIEDDVEEAASILTGRGIALTVVMDGNNSSSLSFRLERVASFDELQIDDMVMNRLYFSSAPASVCEGFSTILSDRLLIPSAIRLASTSREFSDELTTLNAVKRGLSVFESLAIERAKERCFQLSSFEHTKALPNRSALKLQQIVQLTGSRLLSVRSILDLCAHPGGFAAYTDSVNRTCTYHYVSKRLKDESCIPAKFIPERCVDLFKGRDFDLINLSDLTDLTKECPIVDTVLADGAVDIHGDYDHQEELNFALVKAEIRVATRILRQGGAFLLKIFGMMCPGTRSLLVLLKMVFRKVFIVKPPASWAVNSEVYVLCEGYVKCCQPLASALLSETDLLTTYEGEVFPPWYRTIAAIAKNFCKSNTAALRYLCDYLRSDLYAAYGDPVTALAHPETKVCASVAAECAADCSDKESVHSACCADVGERLAPDVGSLVAPKDLYGGVIVSSPRDVNILLMRMQFDPPLMESLSMCIVSDVDTSSRYCVFPTPPDGNCFFHAIGFNLVDHQSLRHYFSTIANSSDALKECAQVGVIAGTASVISIVDRLPLSVVVVNESERVVSKYGEGPDYIYLHFIPGHFSAVLRFCAECKPSTYDGHLASLPHMTYDDYFRGRYVDGDRTYIFVRPPGCLRCCLERRVTELADGEYLHVLPGTTLPDDVVCVVVGDMRFATRRDSDATTTGPRQTVRSDGIVLQSAVNKFHADPGTIFAHCISGDLGSSGHMSRGVGRFFSRIVGKPTASDRVPHSPLTVQRMCEMHASACVCPPASRKGAFLYGVITKKHYFSKPTLESYHAAVDFLIRELGLRRCAQQLILPRIGTGLDGIAVDEFGAALERVRGQLPWLNVVVCSDDDVRGTTDLRGKNTAVVDYIPFDSNLHHVCSAMTCTRNDAAPILSRFLLSGETSVAVAAGFGAPVHSHDDDEVCAPTFSCSTCTRVCYSTPLPDHLAYFSQNLNCHELFKNVYIAGYEAVCYRCALLSELSNTASTKVVFVPFGMCLDVLNRSFEVFYFHGTDGVFLRPNVDSSAVSSLSMLTDIIDELTKHSGTCSHSDVVVSYCSRLHCYTNCTTLRHENVRDRVRVVDAPTSTTDLVIEVVRSTTPTCAFIEPRRLKLGLVYDATLVVAEFEETTMLLRSRLSRFSPEELKEITLCYDRRLELSELWSAVSINDKTLSIVLKTEDVTGDERLAVPAPVFRTVKTDVDFIYNAMMEIRYIWSKTVIEAASNLKAVLGPIFSGGDVASHGMMSRVRDVSFGVIDSRLGTWCLEPLRLEDEGYSFAFALGATDNFVKFDGVVKGKKINKERLAEVRATADCKYFVVSKNTKIMNEKQLVDATLSHVVVDALLNFEIRVVEGVPGAGKTHYILSQHDRSETYKEIVATATKEAAADLRSRSGYKSDDSVSRKKFSRKKYRTLDSLTIHMMRDYKKGEVEVVYFDEASMKHVGQIFWCAMVLGVRRIVICGDRAQISYFNSENYHHEFHRYLREPDERLNVTKRCPADACYALSNIETTNGLAYPQPITTHNTILRSLSCRKGGAFPEFGKPCDTQLLTFTQLDKSEVQRKYPNYSVNTIGEFQGKENKNIVLIRLSTKDNEFYRDSAQLVVALSRHTVSFQYVHPIDDRLSKLIENTVSVEKSKISKHLVRLEGGGYVFNSSRVPRGAIDVNRYFPRLEGFSQVPIFDVRLKPDYSKDLDRECNVLRNLVSQHGEDGYVSYKPTMTDTTMYFEQFLPEPNETEERFSSPINAVQIFVDCIQPGSSCDLSRYDHEVFEQSDFHLSAEGFVTSTDFVVRRRNDTLTPRLRTPCPPMFVQSQKQIIKAFDERNGGVPDVEGRIPYYVFAKRIVSSFVRNMIGDKELLRFYERNKMTINVDSLTDWLSYQDPGILDQIALDPAYSIYEKDLTKYSYILKRIAKPSLDDRPQCKNSSAQAIAHLDKMTNAIFSPLVRDMKHRLYSVLRPDKVVCSDVSVEGFQDILNNRLPPYTLKDYPFRFETDFSKYDKSQAVLALMVDVGMMELLGVPEELIACWILMHVSTRVVALSQRFAASVFYQRKSGDPMTFLGNTLFLMCVLAFLLGDNLKNGFGVFAGDDSYMFLKCAVDETKFIRSCATLFNLEVKVLHYNYPYFCSKFMLPINDRWVCVPDMWKTIIKLGRNDLVNFTHVEEYRVSLMDNLRCLKFHHYWDEYAMALAERYRLGFLPVYIFPAVYSLICDSSSFSSLYYVTDGDIINTSVDNLPSIEI